MKYFCLDTNILIGAVRKKKYAEQFSMYSNNLYISVHTHFEMLVGVEKSVTEELKVRKRNDYNRMLAFINILPYETSHAEVAAWIRADLESKGMKIGVIDTLISAQSLKLGLTLVTNNVGEFSRVKDLEVVSWD